MCVDVSVKLRMEDTLCFEWENGVNLFILAYAKMKGTPIALKYHY